MAAVGYRNVKEQAASRGLVMPIDAPADAWLIRPSGQIERMGIQAPSTMPGYEWLGHLRNRRGAAQPDRRRAPRASAEPWRGRLIDILA